MDGLNELFKAIIMEALYQTESVPWVNTGAILTNRAKNARAPARIFWLALPYGDSGFTNGEVLTNL